VIDDFYLALIQPLPNSERLVIRHDQNIFQRSRSRARGFQSEFNSRLSGTSSY